VASASAVYGASFWPGLRLVVSMSLATLYAV
jgi:hypothetical protein